MPSVADTTTPTMSSSKENQNSAKVLDELMAKLSISKAQEDINAAAHNLSVFINGDIETKTAPTQ